MCFRLSGDATVTISHRHTPKEQLKKHTILADIVVSAAGKSAEEVGVVCGVCICVYSMNVYAMWQGGARWGRELSVFFHLTLHLPQTLTTLRGSHPAGGPPIFMSGNIHYHAAFLWCMAMFISSGARLLGPNPG